MFSKHVRKDLSAYCNGELMPHEAQRLAEHLIACSRCRTELEEIKAGVRLAEQLPKYSAPDSIWSELERLKNQSGRESLRGRSRFSFWQPQIAAVAAVLIFALGLSLFLMLRGSSKPSWKVARLDGSPRIGSSAIGRTGNLAVGQWLETDGSSRAQIEVSSIGHVEIDPNTRVRLLETRPTEHRLELAQGKMSARIWAPPRLFFVDTPSAVAADLGCAYTLEVNDQGASLLHVTSGWVALQLKDRESMVPAGAACQTRPGVGPGTPYFEDASEAFRNALAKFDFEHDVRHEGETEQLEVLLNAARTRDSLTIWHLLFRSEGAERMRVYDRLAELAPPPQNVTREGVLQLNPEMMASWRDSLESTWHDKSPGQLEKTLKKVWATGLGKVRGWEGKK
jgi:FecR protein/Putative zinc-finger